MKDVKLILLGYLAKQHGITEEAAAELLYKPSEDDKDKLVLRDDALKTILAKDKVRVASLKTTAVDETKIYDKAYADAKIKILPKAEKALAKKHGIEGENFKLDTLVDDIIAKAIDGLQGDKLDESAVKKHPLYLTLERESTEEIEKLNTKHVEAVKKIQTKHTKAEKLESVKGKVLAFFDDLKPVLSKDSTKAANQRTDFANRFSSYSYEEQTDGEDLILDSKEERIEDGHGNPISLEKLVARDASKYYDFAVQGDKGGPGNGGDSDKGGGGAAIVVPTSQDAYDMAIIEANTPEEREQITSAYEAATK